jgi:dihydrofolate reductase
MTDTIHSEPQSTGHSQVIWHITASLDGFIAPADDSFDWITPYLGPNPLAAEVLTDIGAVVMGHRQYANAIQEEGRIYGGAWTGPIFVLTHADQSTAVDGFTFCDDLEQALNNAREVAGGHRVVIMGADTARQCIRSGQLDELLVHTVPVMLGAGLRMFDDSGEPIRLERTRADISPTAVNVWYRVDRTA